MVNFAELSDLRAISASLKTIGFSHLFKEETVCANKSEKLIEEVSNKLEVLQALDEHERRLEEEVTAIGENVELLDIETIRTKTQLKKAEKQVGKLASMNTSQVKIDATENDKLKMRTNLAKQSIVKQLTGLQINSEGKGFIDDNPMRIIHINKNNSKEAIRDQLWIEIGECSKHTEEWQRLFDHPLSHE